MSGVEVEVILKNILFICVYRDWTLIVNLFLHVAEVMQQNLLYVSQVRRFRGKSQVKYKVL